MTPRQTNDPLPSHSGSLSTRFILGIRQLFIKISAQNIIMAQKL